jgi:hypothetical protein
MVTVTDMVMMQCRTFKVVYSYLVGTGICPLASVSRSALGPTQPPVQWVPEVLSPGLKLSSAEVDNE